MSGNRTTIGSKARREALLDAVGLSEVALNVLLSVMAHERCFGVPPNASDVRAFLGVRDLSLNELTRGLWLTAEREGNHVKQLSARPRAWSSLGFERDERRMA